MSSAENYALGFDLVTKSWSVVERDNLEFGTLLLQQHQDIRPLQNSHKMHRPWSIIDFEGKLKPGLDTSCRISPS